MTNVKTKKSFLDKLTDFVVEKVAPPLVTISQTRYLTALQNAFITLMPMMILGATATLILNLAGLFGETGLNLPSVANAISAIVTPCKPWLLQLVFISINLLGLLTAMLNGYHLANHYSKKDHRVSGVTGALVALTAFLCFIDWGTLSENFDWPNYVLGAPSMFGAIFISILAVEVYRFLIGKNITIKMPDSVPPMIANAFTAMIPVTVVLIIAAILGRGIAGFDFLAILNDVFAKLVVGGSSFFAQLLGFFLDRLLWFVGLHGSDIVGSVMGPIWTQTTTANVNAFANGQPIPYMFTSGWINFYVRCSVFPIALLCVRSKVKRFKVLGKMALPGTIFNIAEPIMYGLPIVLNPLMFIPWVLGFTVLFIFNGILAALGLTPAIVAMVVWTMPVPIASFIGSGFNILAPVISILNLILIYLIFLPFFRIMEKNELELEQKELEESKGAL